MATASLDELKAAIANGKALLVCGAGVSRAASGNRAPNWKELIESAIDAAPKEAGEDWSARCKDNLASADADLWLSAADVVQSKMGGFDSPPYRAWLKASVGTLAIKKPELLECLNGLTCRIATTNYDELLRKFLGVPARTWLDPSSVAEMLSKERDGVWHIHGVWDHPESVVFSAADYTRVAHRELAQFLLKATAFTDTLVFIGCSNDGLADRNVGKLLEWFGKTWGGLGKKHFALVCEAELNTPGWPANITRIGYGAKHDDLPGFLRSLAPLSASVDVVNSIETQIPDTPIFGRKDEIAHVVEAAIAHRPSLITGSPGMGKTKVAVAVTYAPEIIKQFGQRRVFVSLEGRSDPLDILILLASELGLKPEPNHNSALAAIRRSCEEARAFAILDNAEALIEGDQQETARIFGLVANIPGLSIVVTSRESLAGIAGWERIENLPPLPEDEARALFCSIATAIKPNDPELRPLIEAMEGHALSLTILASRVDSDLDLKPMLERWRREKAQLLTLPGVMEGRLTSVRASVRLSLTSKHMSGAAKRLLAILGFLPDGLPAGGLKAFLGREDRQLTAEKSDAATDALRRLRLIMPRNDGSLRLITPLRECLRLERPLSSPDLERVVSAGLKLLAKAEQFWTENWHSDAIELTFHAANFTEILAAAPRVQSLAKLTPAIELARRVAMASGRVAPSAFVQLATVFQRNDDSDKAVAAAFFAAGDLASRRYELDAAKGYLETARAISARIGDNLGEANALRSLGEVALRRDELDAAKGHFETARAICGRIGDNLGEANALWSLGEVALRRDDLDAAKGHFETARAIYERIGDNLGEANALRSLGDVALRRDELDAAKGHFETSRAIYGRIGHNLGEANALLSLGNVALRRDELDAAKGHFETSRAIYGRIGDNLGEANAVLSLGEVALRRDELDAAKGHFETARAIYGRIGDTLSEANAVLSLGEVALHRDELDAAKGHFETARAIYGRIGHNVGEANAAFHIGLVSMRQNTALAETLLAEALAKYERLQDQWGIAQSGLRLAQLAAARGDFRPLAEAAGKVLRVEARDPARLAGPAWRAFCESLTEKDAERRAALRETARAKWTAIGALGLVRDMLDFEIEMRS